MLKPACALLTILSLLACPLTCMSDAAASEHESPTACSCCCRHDPPQRPSDDGSEGPSAPSDPCANCLCHGALGTKDELSREAGVSAGMLPLDAHWPAAAAIAAPRLAACAVDASPPGRRSGRLLRYELQSLLL